MNDDPDRTIVWPSGNGISDYLPERLWSLNDFTADRESAAAEVAGRLVSLKFITAAVKRRWKFWCTTAAVGLVIGCGLYASSPRSYQASMSLWLTPGPYENATTAANNDVAMAETRTVAGFAVRQLGLRQDPGSFLGTYKVTPITERLLTITASARSSSQAVADANAVAAAFLKFRDQEVQSQQALMQESLDQQVSQAQQRLSSIKSQITQLSAQGQQSRLKTLQAELDQATTTLLDVRQAAIGNQTANGAATAAAVKGSFVVDPAIPLAHSRLKPLVLDAAVGLVLGLLLGMAIVVIQALVSDRLRRRDDVAQALGAPVRLSTGATGGWRRRAPAAQGAEIQRIAAHLRQAVPVRSQGVAALAVVPVDDRQVPASSLVSAAVSCAKEGMQVVVADLCGGAPAAKILGAADPGVHTVRAHDTSLVVMVPERDDLAPVGPLGEATATQRSSFTDAAATACASANLLLTLATLDPALGGEHLATWATDAVAMVTAGRSSWEKIHGVAELVRLSGTRLVSAVLVGADKADESLGLVQTPERV